MYHECFNFNEHHKYYTVIAEVTVKEYMKRLDELTKFTEVITTL
jgi:hypothetical protein